MRLNPTSGVNSNFASLREEMEKSLVSSLSAQIKSAEMEYLERTVKLKGFSRVLKTITKLEKTKEQKSQAGEDIASIERLLCQSRRKLDTVMSKSPDETNTHGVDFNNWVDEMEADLALQDPFALSYDSESEEEVETARHNEGYVSKAPVKLPSILSSNGKPQSQSGVQLSIDDKQRKLLFRTKAAWAIAVLGVVVTTSFLAADFWDAQHNAAFQIVRSHPQTLALPAITICNHMPGLPPFSHFPTKNYPGLPLFGIQRFSQYNRSSSSSMMDLVHPETVPSSNTIFEDVVVSDNSAECSTSQIGFSVKQQIHNMRSNYILGIHKGRECEYCFYCIRFGYKNRILLEPFPKEEQTKVVPALNVMIYRTKMLMACQNSFHKRSKILASVFISEIRRYSKGLEGRGILDFNGQSPDVISMDWYFHDGRSFYDFCCNVYFFSGFFYPSRDKADISYKYEQNFTEKWKQTGAGPYFSAYTWNRNDSILAGPSTEALEKDYYTFDSLVLYAEDPDNVNRSASVRSSTRFAALSAPNTLFKFRKVDSQGKIKYDILRSDAGLIDGQSSVVDVHSVHMDFNSFETESIRTIATMTWPEFLSDMFEFLSLFTGLCIFTLIVAPAHSLVQPAESSESESERNQEVHTSGSGAPQSKRLGFDRSENTEKK